MEPDENVLSYVARMMHITRAKAGELTGLVNDAVDEVLDPEHVQDESPERNAALEQEKHQVNLNEIAARLHVPVNEFQSWTEDEMIFIEYGGNLSEGVAAAGPTALSATANFYCRWYNDVIGKHQRVLLTDETYHRYNEQGEQ